MSEYRISFITKKGVDSIASMLAPEIVSAIKEDLPVTALAAVDEGVAVGAMGGVVNGNAFELISVFVAPEDRRKGAGTALMKALFKLCEAEELEIRAEYTPIDEEGRTLEPFFESLGFRQESVMFPAYLSYESGNMDFDPGKLRGSRSEIFILSETPRKIMDEIPKLSEEEDGMLGTIKANMGLIDKDLSFVAALKGKIRACVLTEHAGDDMLQITPLWGPEEDISDMRLMISYVVERLRESGEQETNIIMPVFDPATLSIADDIRGTASATTLGFVKRRYTEL